MEDIQRLNQQLCQGQSRSSPATTKHTPVSQRATKVEKRSKSTYYLEKTMAAFRETAPIWYL
ncbi:hypothetical protein DPMN_188924 [Dreissena polymorpha]|uniref:Uncharacterized protein n=1 Tax=Dreissena polymorpha TaxID=45954 RepID=A0A9D4DRL8_DREPO|nr:hypothetical protein DPMN_188924 [Dreissena polymorpha]